MQIPHNFTRENYNENYNNNAFLCKTSLTSSSSFNKKNTEAETGANNNPNINRYFCQKVAFAVINYYLWCIN